ncbi:hypothetical protein [Radiobacillus sp. PE A8.2]|uniref:hypothetical protein n=1 Tax=Radiobacillus sp. PE A8.2 TaxID=3380349 RepID=UPI00388ED4A3
METIYKVLQAYQLAPTEVRQITNRLYQVQSSQYSFALKRSRLKDTNINQWKHVYQTASQQQLSAIVPIYMTNNRGIFVQDQQEIYYLSPWKQQIESDEPEHEIESFYASIAKIHKQTKNEQKIDVKDIEKLIDNEKNQLAQLRRKLLSYVEKYERRRFMSPFELRVCMQFRDLEQVFSELDDWYDYYLEDVTEDKLLYSCMCHGNLRTTHMVYQNSQTYFINWERSFFGNSMTDLAIYYYHAFQYHDSYMDQLINAFPIYEKYNPLASSEKSLLAIYLLYPSSYLSVIESYEKKNAKKAQPFQIRSLEQSYRRLMHGLSMQHYLYERRLALQQAAEDD